MSNAIKLDENGNPIQEKPAVLEKPSALKRARNILYIIVIVLAITFAVLFALDRAEIIRLSFLPRESNDTIIGYTEEAETEPENA
ncbi:MAG: hypothetical protein IK104_08285 [Clostridia bacterium]|nr:hypothetical protein [Clostridia bacterium]